MENKNNKELSDKLDKFLNVNEELENTNTEESKLKTDKSLVERVNKKMIVEDGRLLLIN